METTAAVLEELNSPLALRTLEVPYPGVGQVWAKIVYSGVCGKQLVEISGIQGPDRFLPHCLGHEAGAIVQGIGAGVTKVKPGDHVVLHWRQGSGIECPEFPRYECAALGRSVGAGRIATFQRIAVVSENRLTKIPDHVPMQVAALMGCAVTTGLGLVSNEAQIKMGQSVVVIGAGGVGLNVLQGCHLASAYPIVAIDIHESKALKAVSFGATFGYCNRGKDVIEIRDSLRPLLNGGADVVIDTTGHPAAADLAFELCNSRGTVYLVGQMRHDRRVSLQTAPMHSGKQLRASYGGMTDPDTDIPRYLKLYDAGLLDLHKLITHNYPLEKINDLLDEVRAGKVGRAIIRMPE